MEWQKVHLIKTISEHWAYSRVGNCEIATSEDVCREFARVGQM